MPDLSIFTSISAYSSAEGVIKIAKLGETCKVAGTASRTRADRNRQQGVRARWKFSDKRPAMASTYHRLRTRGRFRRPGSKRAYGPLAGQRLPRIRAAGIARARYRSLMRLTPRPFLNAVHIQAPTSSFEWLDRRPEDLIALRLARTDACSGWRSLPSGVAGGTRCDRLSWPCSVTASIRIAAPLQRERIPHRGPG